LSIVQLCFPNLIFLVREGICTLPFKRPRISAEDLDKTSPPPSKKRKAHEGTDSGSCKPKSNNVNKFSVSNGLPILSRIPLSGSLELDDLISASCAKSSWNRHESALNSWSRFTKNFPTLPPWPPCLESLCQYAKWCRFQKDLSVISIKAYIASLKSLCGFRECDISCFSSPKLKAVIGGIENLQSLDPPTKPSRKVMTLPILKLLGHEISKSSWPVNSKRVFWTSCCVAFFGSCRMGELLSAQEKSFSQSDTLLWKDISFISDSHILIHFRSVKTNNPGGEFIDLFAIRDPSICPVAALKGLQSSLPVVNPSWPVFCFSSGKCLTGKTFNSCIQSLLAPHLGVASKELSGHSFRAAIPAMLARFPELSSSEEILGWGRWKSEAYRCYTRLRSDQKRKIFGKILQSFNLE